MSKPLNRPLTVPQTALVLSLEKGGRVLAGSEITVARNLATRGLIAWNEETRRASLPAPAKAPALAKVKPTTQPMTALIRAVVPLHVSMRGQLMRGTSRRAYGLK